ncbi:penicillin-binding protein activator [Thiomicrospira microaerophila]|uniref:penicillin-binding protein activator n=1 Tax=Thiomicrospira microaerophila TaxID=406020 RepID=UPI0005CB4BE6|nr:penicillin-binding protein activator [Thiomicrospira microaerophila]
MLKNIFLLCLLIFISACTSPHVPEKRSSIEDKEPSPLHRTLDTQDRTQQSEIQIDLEQERQQSYLTQNWSRFIMLTELLWPSYDEHQQIALLEDTFAKLADQPAERIEQFAQTPDHALQAWAWLIQTQHKTDLHLKRELEDLRQLTPDLSFTPQLIERFIADIQQNLQPPEQIAVLLPLSGRLDLVGKQIRAGILKHHWHSQSQAKLRFYDTHQSDNIVTLYKRALADGANKVIGPISRDDIEKLSTVAGKELIALNTLNRSTDFFQLSLRPFNEAEQIIEHLERSGYQHVALLNSNLGIDSDMANALHTAWSARQPFKLIHHSYPHNTNSLRREMSQVLNLQHSQSRAGFLSRIIGTPLEHEPRSRQDLDALILIGDEQRTAVLQPQMDFFQLTMPLIGSSLLTPNQLARAPRNRDLKNIQFPTHPASYIPSPLTNTLEALGWDGLLLANQLNKVKEGMFIHGSLGQHTVGETNHIRTQLSWAHYQANGELMSLQQPPTNNFYWSQPPQHTRTQSDPAIIRQQLLDEIIQFEFFERHANE